MYSAVHLLVRLLTEGCIEGGNCKSFYSSDLTRTACMHEYCDPRVILCFYTDRTMIKHNLFDAISLCIRKGSKC